MPLRSSRKGASVSCFCFSRRGEGRSPTASRRCSKLAGAARRRHRRRVASSRSLNSTGSGGGRLPTRRWPARGSRSCLAACASATVSFSWSSCNVFEALFSVRTFSKLTFASAASISESDKELFGLADKPPASAPRSAKTSKDYRRGETEKTICRGDFYRPSLANAQLFRHLGGM